MSLIFPDRINEQLALLRAQQIIAPAEGPADMMDILEEIDPVHAQRRRTGASLGDFVVKGLMEGVLPAEPLFFSDGRQCDPALDGFLSSFGVPLHRLNDSQPVRVARCYTDIEEVIDKSQLTESEQAQGIQLPGVRIHFLPREATA